jgi:hypothetical protein
LAIGTPGINAKGPAGASPFTESETMTTVIIARSEGVVNYRLLATCGELHVLDVVCGDAPSA